MKKLFKNFLLLVLIALTSNASGAYPGLPIIPLPPILSVELPPFFGIGQNFEDLAEEGDLLGGVPVAAAPVVSVSAKRKAQNRRAASRKRLKEFFILNHKKYPYLFSKVFADKTDREALLTAQETLKAFLYRDKAYASGQTVEPIRSFYQKIEDDLAQSSKTSFGEIVKSKWGVVFAECESISQEKLDKRAERLCRKEAYKGTPSAKRKQMKSKGYAQEFRQRKKKQLQAAYIALAAKKKE